MWNPIVNLDNDRDDERQKRRNFSRFQYQTVFHDDVNEQWDGITYERRRFHLEVWVCVIFGNMNLGNLPCCRHMFMSKVSLLRSQYW